MDHLHLPTPDFFSPMQPDIEARGAIDMVPASPDGEWTAFPSQVADGIRSAPHLLAKGSLHTLITSSETHKIPALRVQGLLLAHFKGLASSLFSPAERCFFWDTPATALYLLVEAVGNGV